MLTSFGKTLRKLRIDHSERLLDMAEKLDISVAFLSSVEIGKKSVPVGMEEKIIKLYNLDQETASHLSRQAYDCRKSFTIKPSDTLQHEVASRFMRILNGLPREDLKGFKILLESICKERVL